ncbi:hypothetical protein T439DRAFT_379398 [Meredithblackwellia eburnea MCA 4105]
MSKPQKLDLDTVKFGDEGDDLAGVRFLPGRAAKTTLVLSAATSILCVITIAWAGFSLEADVSQSLTILLWVTDGAWFAANVAAIVTASARSLPPQSTWMWSQTTSVVTYFTIQWIACFGLSAGFMYEVYLPVWQCPTALCASSDRTIVAWGFASIICGLFFSLVSTCMVAFDLKSHKYAALRITRAWDKASAQMYATHQIHVRHLEANGITTGYGPIYRMKGGAELVHIPPGFIVSGPEPFTFVNTYPGQQTLEAHRVSSLFTQSQGFTQSQAKTSKVLAQPGYSVSDSYLESSSDDASQPSYSASGGSGATSSRIIPGSTQPYYYDQSSRSSDPGDNSGPPETRMFYDPSPQEGFRSVQPLTIERSRRKRERNSQIGTSSTKDKRLAKIVKDMSSSEQAARRKGNLRKAQAQEKDLGQNPSVITSNLNSGIL